MKPLLSHREQDSAPNLPSFTWQQSHRSATAHPAPKSQGCSFFDRKAAELVTNQLMSNLRESTNLLLVAFGPSPVMLPKKEPRECCRIT